MCYGDGTASKWRATRCVTAAVRCLSGTAEASYIEISMVWHTLRCGATSPVCPAMRRNLCGTARQYCSVLYSNIHGMPHGGGGRGCACCDFSVIPLRRRRSKFMKPLPLCVRQCTEISSVRRRNSSCEPALRATAIFLISFANFIVSVVFRFQSVALCMCTMDSLIRLGTIQTSH